ncbi:DUF2786 domain-containing protein [Streptacidiphilus sp. ASG 303]|uniref:DUF2786 domain-containing protein n=1 Tax=Streptacidiphilus sp. ASG 303 TaxID=2896847 RepID=UPI001E49B4D8|nr:DUF2786 domain-containing protein [Streptacidiphilus sp. ASG 303]MCD0483964.1 DUF2786 domain-containing protein [Streptacidiphilus sp. ASG 303]
MTREQELDQLIGGAVGAPADAAEDAVDAAASALAAAAGAPAADRARGRAGADGRNGAKPRDGADAVGTALLAAAGRAVRRAWENGWQPADLVRVVRRDLAPHHAALAVDAVAAEGLRYGDGELPPRWAAQLSDLDAAVRWDGGGAHLAAFAAQWRLDRFGAVVAWLELLRLLVRLPRITPVAPPPGSRFPRPGSAPAAAAPRMLARVRALLAKAEATPYAEEADAFTAKAQQLAARYSIDEALLDADPAHPAGGPEARRIGVEEPYAAAKAVLLDAVAAANRCRSVWSSDLGFSTVVGYGPDLDAVELLHASLLAQATGGMNRAADRHHRSGRSRRTRDFRQTFLVAFAGRIRTRLADAAGEAAREAEAEAAAGASGTAARPPLLPVLAAREVAVEDAAERMFPGTVRHRLRGRDLAGWEHGTEAADRARLGVPGPGEA